MVEICISDDGNGFTEQVLFDPFSRKNICTKPGTGIGLSIINKIIAIHGGTLHLWNSENGGAKYHITLPKYS
ncbi:ATP-binding protein [Haloimpatiens sp. FM7315]|uniref:ATP-binding protein n=1 Tax=Haloimpatiens sp. FM7315 TaxID=3298609 RepID=UPI0035A3CAF6